MQHGRFNFANYCGTSSVFMIESEGHKESYQTMKTIYKLKVYLVLYAFHDLKKAAMTSLRNLHSLHIRNLLTGWAAAEASRTCKKMKEIV